MANTYKNIVIIPNRDTAANVVPTIQFSGGDATTNTDINLRVYTTSNGTLSFDGSAGQLFSITNDLSGVIFSVNDISGIPSIEVDANGRVSLAQFSGNVGIGTASPNFKLDVSGRANITSNLIVQGIDINRFIISAFTQANAAPGIANSYATAVGAAGNAYATAVGTAGNTFAASVGIGANTYATLVGASSNAYTTSVGTAGNTFTISVGASSNAWANTIATAANNFAGAMANSANAYATSVGVAGNSYATAVGTSANVYAASVGVGANAFATTIGTSSNSYATAVGTSGNAYATSVGTAGNTYTLAAFNQANVANAVAVYAANFANAINVIAVNAYNTANAAAAGTNDLYARVTSNLALATAQSAFTQANAATISAYKTVKTDYTISIDDKIVLTDNTVTINISLPDATVANGATYQIKNINIGKVIITGNGSNMIDSYANLIIEFKNSSLGLTAIGTGWIIT